PMTQRGSLIAPNRARHVASLYLDAKAAVINRGFSWEIDWQHDRCTELCDETSFLSEADWVVLSSGLAERVVRKKFEHVSAAFNQWSSAATIWTARKQCRQDGLLVFNSIRKI